MDLRYTTMHTKLEIMETSHSDKIEQKFSFRFLINSDIEQYKDFVFKFDTLMKIKKTKEIEKNIFDSFDLPLKKTVGVFDNNGNLLLTQSGYFPENFCYWYGHNHMSLIENLTDFAFASHKADNILCNYGENMEYYSHYSRRPIGHQRAFNRLLLKKIPDIRYNMYYEKIYKAGETCKFSNHKFYFYQESFPFDTVIILHCLKQEHRVNFKIK